MHCSAHHRQALALISELRVQRYRVFLLPPNISPTFLLKSRKKCKISLLWHISTTFLGFHKPFVCNMTKDPMYAPFTCYPSSYCSSYRAFGSFHLSLFHPLSTAWYDQPHVSVSYRTYEKPNSPRTQGIASWRHNLLKTGAPDKPCGGLCRC